MTLEYVMAPEEDAGGGAAVAAVAEPPASSPEAAPPAPATPEPDSPATDEPEAGDEPAAEDDGEPAEAEDEAPPEDGLSDDDWQDLYKRHPERDPKNIEAKLRQELAEAAKTPERQRDVDPLYQQIRMDSDAAFQYIAQAREELEQGGFTQDPRQLAAVMDLADAYGAVEERRGQIMLNRAVFERETGIDMGKVNRVIAGDAEPDSLDDVERAYADAITALDREQVACYRTHQSALSQFDAAKRKELASRAMLRDATATGAFSHTLIKLARESGRAEGRRDAEKGLDRRMDKVADQARRNGQTEAIAKARAIAAAGRANGATSNGNAAPARSEDEILLDPRTPVSQLIEIRSRQKGGR